MTWIKLLELHPQLHHLGICFFLLFSPFPAKPSIKLKAIREPIHLVMIPWLFLLLNENSHEEWKCWSVCMPGVCLVWGWLWSGTEQQGSSTGRLVRQLNSTLKGLLSCLAFTASYMGSGLSWVMMRQHLLLPLPEITRVAPSWNNVFQ